MNFRHFLLLILTLLHLPLWAEESSGSEILNSYAELLQGHNRGESLELQAGRVDRYLKMAKAYLREESGSSSDEFMAIESSVKKLKVFQYLFNSQQDKLQRIEASSQYKELLNYFLQGAMNSSPTSNFQSNSYDFAAIQLDSFDEDLIPYPLFIEKTEGININREVARIEFLRSMIKDSLLKNQLANWTIKFAFDGIAVDCQYVDRQVQERCLVVSRILNRDRSFETIDHLEFIHQVYTIRQEAKESLEGQIDKAERFRPGRFDQTLLDRVNLPSVNKKFADHIQILNKIKNIRFAQLLKAEPRAKALIESLSAPMVTRYCEVRNYPAIPNCGYKYSEENKKALTEEFIAKTITKIKIQIQNEAKRLNDQLKVADKLHEALFAPMSQEVSNYQVISNYNNHQRIVSTIDKYLIKEMQINPQSTGAALMEFPQFIPYLSDSVVEVIDRLNVNQFKDNLISVGVIAALVGTSFITVPVGVGLGFAITIYEIVHYSNKEKDAQHKLNAASVEMIEYQYKDLDLNREELQLLERRFNEMNDKINYYRMNTYFAAAGLITAPIAFGHVISASSNKLTSLLDNMKFIEKFSQELNQSTNFSKRVNYFLKMTKIEHPDQLLTAVLKLRRYIQEARTLSEALFIHRLHHLIQTPEKLHLSERSFAGAGYLKKMLKNSEMEKELLAIILHLEEQPSNYFSE